MIILGLILLLLGFLLGIYFLWVLGIILLVVGVVLLIAGRAGHTYRGRTHWW